jgi:hypothetical protein
LCTSEDPRSTSWGLTKAYHLGELIAQKTHSRLKGQLHTAGTFFSSLDYLTVCSRKKGECLIRSRNERRQRRYEEEIEKRMHHNYNKIQTQTQKR